MVLQKIFSTIIITVAIITGGLIASQETEISPEALKFIEIMKDDGRIYFSEENYPSLIVLLNLIAPSLDSITAKAQSILFNDDYQIGMYFKEAILNAVLDNKDTFFTNSLDEKFKTLTKFGPKEIAVPSETALSDIEQYKYIYTTFFGPLVLEGSALQGEQFSRILPLLANLATFLFGDLDGSSLARFVNGVKKVDNENQKNNLMHILTDASIRIYCYAHNERSEAFKKASRFQKVRMYTMSILKNPIPTDTIAWCMRRWRLVSGDLGTQTLSTVYLGDNGKGLKNILQKWLTDKKEVNSIANQIISAERPFSQRPKSFAYRISETMASSPRNVTQQLVGTAFLLALDAGIIQSGVAKAKTYYEAGKTRAAAIGSSARQYLEAQRERARTYYRRLKESRFGGRGKSETPSTPGS